VVSRLCQPIEGTDAAHIADCLGLDASKFHAQVVGRGLHSSTSQLNLSRF
jgi:DNA polymerase alpha subunit A